ncbi:MAG: fatty acid desaturase [Actinomycetota bacterium]|nr:fatty acid desaturase [Actinomycetota bacterium]
MTPVILGVVVGLITCEVALFTTSLYLHRALAHRAVRIHPAATFACRITTWMLTGIKPRQWVAVHRKHHAFTDEAGDPHSPVVNGFTKVLFGNALYYRAAARDPEVVARYAQDLTPDRLDRWLLDRGLVGLGLAFAVGVVLLGWQAALVAGAVSVSGYLLAGGAINAVGHRFGSRPYPNTATNSRVLGVLIAGEGLHNNHHGAPTSARFAHRRGEVDPCWWLISLLTRSGLAKVRLNGVHVRPVRSSTAARAS